MSRFTPKQQIALIRARMRHDNLVKLLDSYEWKREGYADKFEWLRDMFGQKHDSDLLLECQKVFEREGLL
jgi:hypothetical protein